MKSNMDEDYYNTVNEESKQEVFDLAISPITEDVLYELGNTL